MPLPTFFVVGAPKAGTTSLYSHLDQHPAVYMSPIKEPTFFAPEVIDFGPEARRAFDQDQASLRAYLHGPMHDKRPHGIVVDWSDYLKLFKNAGNETAIGEASVSYLGSLGAARAIRTRIPHARIVMILRDPVDRLFSHYASAHAVGVTDRTFLDWVEEQAAAEAARHPPFGPIWAGFYAKHLQRFRDVFPAPQVRVLLYERYRSAPARTLADLLAFLGVDPDWPVDITRRHNVTLVPRWARLQRRLRPVTRVLRRLAPSVVERLRDSTRVPLGRGPTADERARVIARYADDVERLQDLVQADLSAWLDPARGR